MAENSHSNVISYDKLIDSEISTSIITLDSTNYPINPKQRNANISLLLSNNSNILCEIEEEKLFNISYKLKSAVNQIQARIKQLDN